MISFFLGLLLITCLLWIGFKVTGAVLIGAFWLFIKVPLALITFLIGIVCCCTLILIPVGLGLFKVSISLLIPGTLI